MSPSVTEWRPTAAYLYLLSLDADGLAWEYLRRNPAYRAQFLARNRTEGGSFWLRWGLRFRPGSREGRARSRRFMD